MMLSGCLRAHLGGGEGKIGLPLPLAVATTLSEVVRHIIHRDIGPLLSTAEQL